MSTDDWPLSAAATQLLADLREDGAPLTPPQTISRLAVKELVLRGHIRILEVKKRKWRSTSVLVQVGPAASAAHLPAPLDLLAARLPQTSRDELSSVIKSAAKHHPTLFSKDLRDAALEDLRRHGLVEDRAKKVLKVWTTTFPAPTERGRNGIAHAQHRIHQAASLPVLEKDADRAAAVTAARSLGALVLLAPAGLIAATELSEWVREQMRRGGQALADVDVTGLDDAFDVLAACGDALGHVIDSLGGDIASAIDGSLDSAVSAIDSGIDSGISAGGGDGSSGGDGGSGCGGGGCGGGCGGS